MSAIDSDGLRQRSSRQELHKAPVIHLSRSSSSSSLSSQSEQAISFVPPNFTIKELLGAIPAHCFERSALKSGSYLLWDLILSAAFIYAASHIDTYLGSNGVLLKGTAGLLAQFSAWALYGYAAGLVWTGIWVIAHECGHQAFSASKTVNNTVGSILHTALLVPYHSWRISHARHHAATGHMTRDQVFVPKTRSQRGLPPLPANATKRERDGFVDRGIHEKLDDLLEDAPIWNLLNLFVQQLFGWPAYILVNASGQAHYPKWTSHFNPSCIVFDERHRSQVLISNLYVGLMLTALTIFGLRTSFLTVVKYYIVPYLWVNHWLVMITFLQHTDPLVPHYREGAFNFQRGALCTVDRNLHGFLFHGISETHVVHHLCSKIPHYNAWDATAALKEKLGPYYYHSDENCWKSLYRIYTECKFVEDEGDVVFFKNAKGHAARKAITPDKVGHVSDSGVDVTDQK